MIAYLQNLGSRAAQCEVAMEIYSTLASAVTVISFVVFVGIVAWAYGSGRKRAVRGARRNEPFALAGRNRRPRHRAQMPPGERAMSDFTSGFWELYVAVLTLVSILACGVLLYVMGHMRVSSADAEAVPAGQSAPPATSGTRTSPSTTIRCRAGGCGCSTSRSSSRSSIWSLYPGLGKVPGALGWTSAGVCAGARSRTSSTRVRRCMHKYLAMDLKDVARIPQATAHGRAAVPQPLRAVPRLGRRRQQGLSEPARQDWLYGGDPEIIKESITNGRNGIMPPFGSVLGGEGVKNVANYVRSLSGLTVDSLRVQLGKPLFLQTCAACHGMDGKGNPALGAPNLTDPIWLYGGTEATIVETITKGRGEASTVTRMPAHKDLLDDGKIQSAHRVRVGTVERQAARYALRQRDARAPLPAEYQSAE